jgi:hypothetical protein
LRLGSCLVALYIHQDISECMFGGRIRKDRVFLLKGFLVSSRGRFRSLGRAADIGFSEGQEDNGWGIYVLLTGFVSF